MMAAMAMRKPRPSCQSSLNSFNREQLTITDHGAPLVQVKKNRADELAEPARDGQGPLVLVGPGL